MQIIKIPQFLAPEEVGADKPPVAPYTCTQIILPERFVPDQGGRSCDDYVPHLNYYTSPYLLLPVRADRVG